MLTRIVEKRVYDFGHVVGGRQITGLYSLGLGWGDDVYIVIRRTGDPHVEKVSIGSIPEDEELLEPVGEKGEKEGQFIWPAGVAIDSKQNVYVTDEWLQRVSVFDPQGTFLRMFGTSGNRDSEFNGPSGIALDENDNIYIVDSRNHRIQKFTSEGTLITRWGKQGAGVGEFNAPWGLTIDAQGNVYVADHKNHRIQKFTEDGEFISQLGAYGSEPDQFDHPSSVAVDYDGDIYVCDWANSRVQAFDSEGNFVTSFVGDAQELSKWQKEYVSASPDVYKARRRVYSLEPEWRFALPMSVVFDNKKSRMLVADSQRWRIQIYNKLQNYSDPQFNI